MNNPITAETKNWSINWHNVYDHLFSVIWQLFITSLIFYLIAHFGKKIINHYFTKNKDKLTKRTKTIAELASNIFQYTVLFFYLFGILSILGLPVGTLLASAGIFSLAIGMGAQGFVSDLINGFFILSENQFNVGDFVRIGQDTGTVMRLGIRTTVLQHSDQSLTYIPNRNITNVTNITHGGYGINIDLSLRATNNLDDIKKAIEKANEQLMSNELYLGQAPQIYGIIDQIGPNITYRIHLQVIKGNSITIKNDYLMAYIAQLQKYNIIFGQTNSNELENK